MKLEGKYELQLDISKKSVWFWMRNLYSMLTYTRLAQLCWHPTKWALRLHILSLGQIQTCPMHIVKQFPGNEYFIYLTLQVSLTLLPMYFFAKSTGIRKIVNSMLQ